MYPMSATAPTIHSANEGVNASQARDALTKGAIVGSIVKSRVKSRAPVFRSRNEPETHRQTVSL